MTETARTLPAQQHQPPDSIPEAGPRATRSVAVGTEAPRLASFSLCCKRPHTGHQTLGNVCTVHSEVMKRLIIFSLALTLVWIPTITCEEFPSQGNSSLGVFGPLDPVQTEFSRIHSNAIGWNGSLPFHDPNSTYFRV